MHVLGADGAGVGLLHDLEDVPERQLVRREQGARVEHDVHVVLVETVIGRLQVRQRDKRFQLQRVEVGVLVAADAVGVDQAQYLGLAFGGDGGKAAAAGNPGILIACELQKVLLYPAVRQVVDRAAIDRGEAVKVRCASCPERCPDL